MPPVFLFVGSAILGAVGVGASATTIALAMIVGKIVVFSGLAFLGSKILGQFLPKPPTSSNLISDVAAQMETIRSTVKPRDFVVGTTRRAGTLSFFDRTTSGADKFIHMVVTLTGMDETVNAITEFYLGDELVPLDGSGDATGTYAGFVHVEKNLGTLTQSAFAGLVADIPAKWTTAHKQLGCAGLYVRIKESATKFPNGIASPRATIEGAKVWDPRTSTTVFSNNPALIARWWAVHKWGLRIPAAEIDDDYVISAANICDENVNLNGGGTQKRFTCDGGWDLSQDPKQVLIAILSSMAGDMYRIGDKWRMYAGAWTGPTTDTIGAGDLRGEVVVEPMLSTAESFNAVKGRFSSPTDDYQATDYPILQRAKFLAEDSGYASPVEAGRWITATSYLVNDAVMHGGQAYICTVAHTSGSTTEPGVGASWGDKWSLCSVQRMVDLDLPFTTNAIRCRRIAKQFLEANRRPTRAKLPLKLSKLNVTVPDILPVTLADFSWTAKNFKLTQSRFTAETAGRGRVVYGMDAEARETAEEVFAWATTDELF